MIEKNVNFEDESFLVLNVSNLKEGGAVLGKSPLNSKMRRLVSVLGQLGSQIGV